MAEIEVERRMPQLALVVACSAVAYVFSLTISTTDGGRYLGDHGVGVVMAVAGVPLGVLAAEVLAVFLVAVAGPDGRRRPGRVALGVVGVLALLQAGALALVGADALVGRGWILAFEGLGDRMLASMAMASEAALLGAVAWCALLGGRNGEERVDG